MNTAMTERLAELKVKPFVPSEPEINDLLAENTGGGNNPRSRIRYMLTALRDNASALSASGEDLLDDLVKLFGTRRKVDTFATSVRRGNPKKYASLFDAYVHANYPVLVETLTEQLGEYHPDKLTRSELFELVENMGMFMWSRQETPKTFHITVLQGYSFNISVK